MDSLLAKFKPWRLLIVVVGLIAAIYVGTANNGFVWDDTRLIVKNESIGDWQTLPDLFLGQSLFESHGAVNKQHIYYKPLLGLWWMINYHQWGGAMSGSFHLTQLGLHLVNVVLVFFISKKILQVVVSPQSHIKPQALAFWLALLWGLHPGNSESVLYIAAAQEPLYLFWGLLSWLLITHRHGLFDWFKTKHNWPKAKSTNLVLVLVGGCWLASLLSKEAGLVFAPISILLVAVVETDQSWRKFAWVGLITWLVYFFMRFGLAGIGLTSLSPSIPIHRASTYQRLLTVPYVLFEHLRIAAIPKDLFTGNYVVIQHIDVIWVAKLLTIIGVIGLMFTISRGDRLLRWLFFSGIISLGLVSNIFPLDMTFSERWVYLPILFFLWFWLWWGMQRFRWLSYMLIGVALLYAGRVHARIPNWYSEYTLSKHDSQYEVNGYQVAINYAFALIKRGERDEATKWLEKSIQMNPEYWVAYSNLGDYYYRQGDVAKAEDYFLTAIEKGNSATAWENLNVLYYLENNPEFEETIQTGLRYYPNNTKMLYLQRLEATKSAQTTTQEN